MQEFLPNFDTLAFLGSKSQEASSYRILFGIRYRVIQKKIKPGGERS